MTKLALVTGGARRIGREICKTLSDGGYNVLIHANKSLEEAEQLCAEIQKDSASGCKAQVIQADFFAPNAANSFINAVKVHNLTLQRGGLDALIHNASIYEATPAQFYENSINRENSQLDALLSSELSLLRRMLLLHMEIPHQLTLGLLPELRAVHGGVIALTDTSLGQSWSHRSAYTSSKAGLQQLMKNFAGDLAPAVRCNCVSPGPILQWADANVVEDFSAITGRVPLQRAGTPREVATAVHFLLENKYITGHTLVVDGGISLRSAE